VLQLCCVCRLFEGACVLGYYTGIRDGPSSFPRIFSPLICRIPQEGGDRDVTAVNLLLRLDLLGGGNNGDLQYRTAGAISGGEDVAVREVATRLHHQAHIAVVFHGDEGG
jgi:hypothetical protein